MNITVSGTITEEQYIKMMMRFRLTKTDAIVRFVFGVLLTLIGIYTSMQLAQGQWPLILAGMVLIVSFPLRLLVFYRKSYRSNKAMQKIMTYTFTDSGYKVVVDSDESTIAWENLHRIHIAHEAFFLYQTNSIFSGVMKHWFAPEQLDEFTAFVKERG